MSEAVAEQVQPSTPAPPPSDPDATKWEALAKELNVEPEGQPEPEPQPQPEPQPRAKPEHVPYTEHENVQKALREAREQARAAQEQIRAWQQVVEDARARRAQPQPQKDEPKPLPKVEEDPIGHFTGRIADLEAKLQEARQGTQQTAEQVQQQRDEAQFWNHVQTSENQFRATTPKVQHEGKEHSDYDLAVEHLAATRVKELELMYPDASEQAMRVAQQNGFRSPADMRAQLFNADRINVAMQAVQLGMNPAELYYNLAKQRGYQTPNGQARAPNGQFVEKAAQQLSATKRGQAAAVSISGGNTGRKGADDMAISDLADLFVEDADAADKIWDQMKRAGRLG